jgi:hypothetical protein
VPVHRSARPATGLGRLPEVIAGILPDKLEVDVKHEIARIERVIIDKVIEDEPAQPVVDATSTQHDRDMLKIAKHIQHVSEQ